MSDKWRVVSVVALGEFLAISLWFSASAVTPALVEAWALKSGDAAWLTMSVQIGFVVGALLSATFNLADIWAPRRLFAAGAWVGAGATFLFAAVADAPAPALVLRFTTGVALAAVYPVGMKIMATWMKSDRGLGLGLLVGALTLGSALPHLLRAFGSAGDWRIVLYSAGALAVLGGFLVLRYGAQGPYQTQSPPFNWRFIGQALADRGVRLANFGYLGHMWELYAMWTWVPLFLLGVYESAESFPFTQDPARAAAVMAFAVIGVGAVGSLAAGVLADRFGRTTITIASMLISGASAVIIGFTIEHPLTATVVALVWGVSVVADSAQFSTAVSELSPRAYMGTALTMQTAFGFLLTLASIRLIPVLVQWVGWQWAFAALAVGPAVGTWAMVRLRRSPHARLLAEGRG